jgi:bifunctional DNA-binding transcriptional regulator/antitoxin component of YhaV-PrlF toxin-antitoxin module
VSYPLLVTLKSKPKRKGDPEVAGLNDKEPKKPTIKREARRGKRFSEEDVRTAVKMNRRGPSDVTTQVRKRQRGTTRISAQHQVTIPVDALARAGLRAGDRLRAEPRGPGEILLVREEDALDRYAGSLTGVYPDGYLEELRGEWA